jgi:hypothetical protein
VKTKRAGFLGALESLMNINNDGKVAEEDDSTNPAEATGRRCYLARDDRSKADSEGKAELRHCPIGRTSNHRQSSVRIGPTQM